MARIGGNYDWMADCGWMDAWMEGRKMNVIKCVCSQLHMCGQGYASAQVSLDMHT